MGPSSGALEALRGDYYREVRHAVEQALGRTRAYLVERQAFGHPLMANQHLQFALAELSALTGLDLPSG